MLGVLFGLVPVDGVATKPLAGLTLPDDDGDVADDM
jgi:hypothetical protein